MAPKKTKEYSNDLREVVIKHYLNGNNEREIAQSVLIPRTSVHYMIQKYKSTKCIGNIIGRGRKRKTTSHTDRNVKRKIKADRQQFVGVLVKSVYTVVARKKPYVSKINRGKRLEYAVTYREKPLGFWNSVLWSEESKFNLFGSDGKIMVWRTTAEEFNPRCTVPTVKHGGGNVKCWGCFSASGVGNLVFIDGNMTGELYRDILQKKLLQSVKKLNMNTDWYFQHDSDSKYRTSIVTNWLDRERMQRLKRPSCSPDINPIEYLWDEMERRMKKHQPKNEKELKDILTRIWYGIEQSVLKKLVHSVPNRLNEVIRTKGYPTRY
ncbi:unnamed protein product [Rotaria socialis]|uniref:Tc1-like transposase DDE domain-containing protein n=2 Tax=Rotaria socialis TaxID=392032 RepID=A0A818U889_9BILA|nr:unnamed protein product [Rotaria socialis]CAF4847355.1 unnamed protein product [Rotaria socialis]